MVASHATKLRWLGFIAAVLLAVTNQLQYAGAEDATIVSRHDISQKTPKRELEAITTGLNALGKLLNMPLVTKFSDLQNTVYKKGEATRVPWPSSYWPTYLDGINYQWSEGQPSAVAKYAQAFGINNLLFSREMSSFSGMLSDSRRRPCTADEMCLEGSVCVMGYDLPSGYCIYLWEGLCHSWAAAAVIEKEPQCPVELNSVTFQPLDIKVLLAQVYHINPPDKLVIGSLYAGSDTYLKDDSSRPTDSNLRDVNPGIFHIALANVMDKAKKAFVIDRVALSEVWNQPVRSYEVLEMIKVTVENGSMQFFNASKYPWCSIRVHL